MTTTRLFLYNEARRAQQLRKRAFLRLVKLSAALCALAFCAGYLRGVL